jgi:Protein of unknown function, DUF547
MKKIFFCLLLLPFLGFSQPDYKAYDAFLQKYVSAKGSVNYKKIKQNKTELEMLIKQFQNASPQKTWSKNEQLAYWLNAYNLFTINLIVNNYPLKKITDLSGGKPWDVKNIKIGGQNYSLNQIENDIIRPTFQDARIHFALNCAAKSCPPLHNKAFIATTLNTQLEQRTKEFINSKSNIITKKNLKISKIFDWYGSDFTTKNNTIQVFFSKYTNVKIEKDAKIEFLEYDWSLNE